MSWTILNGIQKQHKHNKLLLSCSFCSSLSPPSDQTSSLVSNIVSLLMHHRSKSRWGHLYSLLHQQQQLTPNQFSLIILNLKNKPHLALNFFNFTQRHKIFCKHSLFSYSTLIHILSRNRHVPQARNLIRVAIRLPELHESDDLCDFRERKEQNLPLLVRPLRVFESLVKTYKVCGSAPFVFDLLIKECLESKKIDSSIEIVRLLRSRGISPRVDTLNELIWEVSKCRGACEGFDIYREVFSFESKSEGDVKWVSKVKPNVHSFTNLMVSFHREGLFKKAEAIWTEMVDSGCNPNVSGYSALISLYCDQGKMREAEKLWDQMKVKGLEHDLVCYSTMIGGLCKIGEVSRADEFYRAMELSGIESSCATYEHLVKGYCNIGDLESAMLVYKDMKRKGFRPEPITVEVLTGGLCDKMRIVEAVHIMRDVINPSEKAYEILIKGLCDEGMLENAFKFQAEMVGKGFKPNSEIYSAFAEGYVKLGNLEMAERLKKELLENQEC